MFFGACLFHVRRYAATALLVLSYSVHHCAAPTPRYSWNDGVDDDEADGACLTPCLFSHHVSPSLLPRACLTRRYGAQPNVEDARAGQEQIPCCRPFQRAAARECFVCFSGWPLSVTVGGLWVGKGVPSFVEGVAFNLPRSASDTQTRTRVQDKPMR